MNSVILIGRLTADPELRYTQGQGTAVANFTLAVDNPFNKNATDFIRCVAWKAQAENLAKYCGKGSQVAVEGRLQVRGYDDRDGNRRTIAEVVTNRVQFLDSRKREEAPALEEDDVLF